MRVNDALTGAALVLFALVMMWHTRTFPTFQGQDYGPDLFPRLIGTGMVLIGLILVVGGIRTQGRGPLVTGATWLRSPPHLLRVGAVVGGLLAYVLISDALGFIITAFVLLTVWLIVFRDGKPVSSIVIAALVTLVVNYVFTTFLLVPLPLGIAQSLLY